MRKLGIHPICTGNLAPIGPLFIQKPSADTKLHHASIQNTLIYAYLTSRTRNDKARTFFLKMPRL